MFIQKIFHVHQSLEDTRASLAALPATRRVLEGVQKIVLTADGVTQLDCTLPHGLHAHGVLVPLPTPDSDQILFRSTAGNVQISGLLEFAVIREHLTEVQLTLQYAFKSPMHALVDAMTHAMEHFIEGQLRRIQTHLDGVLAHMPGTTATHTAHIPELAH